MSLHIGAESGAIAEKILLPGDPLRAKHIAETFLEDVVCYNQIRGMFGFTGTYKGKRISVQGTGMGMPSISIYVNELLSSYGAKQLIRVGTCGSIQESLKLRDIVIASGASTDSRINLDRFDGMSFAATANFELLRDAFDAAARRGLPAVVGNVLTCDQFYDDKLAEKMARMAAYGTLAIDMETHELYTLAAKFKAQALTLMTVSDHLVTHEVVKPEDRQTTFNAMIEVALEII